MIIFCETNIFYLRKQRLNLLLKQTAKTRFLIRIFPTVAGQWSHFSYVINNEDKLTLLHCRTDITIKSTFESGPPQCVHWEEFWLIIKNIENFTHETFAYYCDSNLQNNKLGQGCQSKLINVGAIFHRVFFPN